MKINADDRAFLESRMSDVSVATMLNWSLARVERARVWIAENPAPAASIAEPPSAPAAIALIGKAAGPAPAIDPADLIGAEPAQIDLEEAIAAATPLGPHGSPAGLSAAGLAAWLVDNTDLAFDAIATTAGVPLGQVQAIADDEPWPPTPKIKPAGARKAQKAATVAATPSRPPTARNPAPAPARSEIPARVLRWARWFVDARWQVATVAGLFDCDPADLAAALR